VVTIVQSTAERYTSIPAGNEVIDVCNATVENVLYVECFPALARTTARSPVKVQTFFSGNGASRDSSALLWREVPGACVWPASQRKCLLFRSGVGVGDFGTRRGGTLGDFVAPVYAKPFPVLRPQTGRSFWSRRTHPASLCLRRSWLNWSVQEKAGARPKRR